ncbi:synaptonemal complex protein 1-like isoform X1 [Mytilus trossulus]|uniref:synaptonemal complex protein 1-like isoform X1 n=1 Tax=Mytilus trossulus TaxID=6551 RepID=UPI0030064876
MMQAQREKQPFFKPLSNLSTNEMTSPSSLYESAVRQKTNQTTFHINRQKENESTKQDQTVGTEKLSSLHAKLHQEADRIRKWKVQTEIEIRQKDKKIQEATQTVESLRKSVLELQLQNESLSLKLQEEMGSREDIMQRINATRDMCNLLKEHGARTEERLLKCETERTVLKGLEKDHLKQFEGLSRQFSELEITANENRDHLTNLLNVERQEKVSMEKELKGNVAKAELKLNHLENQCEEKDIEIRDVRADLRKNEEKMHEIMCHLENCRIKLTTLQEDFDKKESLLCNSDDELTRSKKHCSILETQIKELTDSLEKIQNEKELLEKEYKDTENTLNTQIECFTTELEACNLELKTEKERVVSLRDQLEKALNSIEDIKSAKDLVIMEKSEMECHLNSVIQQKDQLETEREENLKTMSEMNSTIEEIKCNLHNHKEKLNLELATSDDLRNQIDILDMEKKKMNDDIGNLVQELASKNEILQRLQSDIAEQRTGSSCLNDEVARMSQLLQEEREKLEDMFIQKRNLGDELQSLQQELLDKDTELNSKHKDLEKSSKLVKKLETKLEECTNSEEQLRFEIQDLKSSLEIKISEIENLNENREEQDKVLNDELEHKAKETNALDTKIKTLKENVSTKTKQVKELEKEMRALKSKVTSQTKEAENKEKQIEELSEELRNIIQEKQDLETQNNELRCHANEEKKAADEARKEEKQMKKLSEKASKDKEEMVQKCEHQIAEMMSTLEKYQQENQKIVAEKEKEIGEMRNLVEQSESRSKMETNDVISDLNNKMQDLNKKLSSTEGEKVSADKKVTKLERKVKKYETDISKMETKIKSLQDIVDVIKSKKTENIGIQTELEIQNSKLPVTSPSRKRTDIGMKQQQKERTTTPNIRVAPKTPQLNHMKMDVKTPEVPRTPVLFKTPTTQTPMSAMRTPQRSILKNTDRNSAVKKRRVAFESDGSESDCSSSSELMEVEIGEVDFRYKAGQKNLPLHVRPSPKIKTPEIRGIGSDDDEMTDRSRIPLQRKPRGPPVPKTPKQEARVNLSLNPLNKENVHQKFDIAEKKMVGPRTPNIRKTPSKPPGKFFKSSPKDRPSQKAKQKEETWFDIDSVFGFED